MLPNQVIEVEYNRLFPNAAKKLEILKTGPGWIAVNKCSGEHVLPGEETETDSILNALLSRFPEIEGIGEGMVSYSRELF